MNNHTKRKISTVSVYATLALIVVSIICIGIITFTSANKPAEPVATPSLQPPASTSSHQTSIVPNRTSALTPTPEPTPYLTPSPDDTTELPAGNDEPESFQLPCIGNVMKEFSVEVPVFSFTMNDYRTHSGIDISAPVGSSVCSIAKGMVCEIYDDVLLGKTVMIDHGNGVISVYSNLADDLAAGITKGMGVGQGQIIGAVGNTALIECAESDHLHFEITVDKKHVDPMSYLDFSGVGDEDTPGNE